MLDGGRSTALLHAIAWGLVGLAFFVSRQPAAVAQQSKDIARIALAAPPEEPQLRLQIPGHTATIRALAFTSDSQRLCSAGDDKAVLVWRMPDSAAAAKDIFRVRRGPELEQRIRWAVTRGNRGAIYALAAAPSADRMVFGGMSAWNVVGELVWASPRQGRFLRSLRADERQSIAALAFSSDGRWLVSADTLGAVRRWSEGDARSALIRPSDPSTTSAAPFRPMAVAGSRTVIVPNYAGTVGARRTPQWRLHVYDLVDTRLVRELPAPHWGCVTALAASADGRLLASADQARRLLLWDLARPDAPPRELKSPQAIISLAFDPKGELLAAGTAREAGQKAAELQLWNVAQGILQRPSRSQADAVYACAFSPDGRWLAYGGAEQAVVIESLAAPATVYRIEGGPSADQVAFLPGSYDVALARSTTAGEPEPYWTFDTEGLELRPADGAPAAVDRGGGWRTVHDPPVDRIHRIRLFDRHQPRGAISVEEAWQGVPRCECWIPGRDGQPAALAVGTSAQNGIYLYEAVAQGYGRLLRYFHGQSGAITALDASADGRYLVSSSADGTVAIWRLNGLDRAATDPLYAYWGIALEDRQGEAVVSAIDASSPLHSKGVRAGDVLAEIRWPEGGKPQRATAASQIRTQLSRANWWNTQTEFVTRRGGKAGIERACRAAWYPLLTLYTRRREWIAWTPSGYYTSSGGGERLVGWQLNGALGEAPRFLPADSFHQELRQPGVIRRLLAAGRVESAVAEARAEAASRLAELDRIENRPAAPAARRPTAEAMIPDSAISDILPPQVKIYAPAERYLETPSSSLEVKAYAEATPDQPVVGMRLVVDGRPYPAPQGGSKDVGRWKVMHESWKVDLSPGEHTLVVVARSARSEQSSEPLRVVVASPADEPPPLPSLYVLAIGIAAYPGDLALQRADADANALVETLQSHTAGIYSRVEARVLLNRQATRSGIEAGLDWLHERMTADDVGIVFFSGHGLAAACGCEPGKGPPDREDLARFHFVPADVDQQNLPDSCIPDGVLESRLQSTPGKLLLWIDACHAGAARIPQHVLRFEPDEMLSRYSRNDCGVFLLLSSKDDQYSYELKNGGAFTQALVAGLAGSADAQYAGGSKADGLIEAPAEIAGYVQQQVSRLTGGVQVPVFGSTPMANFPLTRADAARLDALGWSR